MQIRGPKSKQIKVLMICLRRLVIVQGRDGRARLRAPGQNTQSNNQIGKFQGKKKKTFKTIKKIFKLIKQMANR